MSKAVLQDPAFMQEIKDIFGITGYIHSFRLTARRNDIVQAEIIVYHTAEEIHRILGIVI